MDATNLRTQGADAMDYGCTQRITDAHNGRYSIRKQRMTRPLTAIINAYCLYPGLTIALDLPVGSVTSPIVPGNDPGTLPFPPNSTTNQTKKVKETYKGDDVMIALYTKCGEIESI